MTKLESRPSWRNSKIHWDGEWFIEQQGKTSCSQGINSTRDLDVKASRLKLNFFCLTSALGCTSLPVPALQRACRVGSETATVDLHPGTIPASAACRTRSWVKACRYPQSLLHVKDSQEYAPGLRFGKQAAAARGVHRLVKLKRECRQVVNTSCQEESTSLILEQPQALLILQQTADRGFLCAHLSYTDS